MFTEGIGDLGDRGDFGDRGSCTGTYTTFLYLYL